jgi:hypothetical protein
LELHPDKTRRIEFGRFAEQNRGRRGEGKPETFDFLAQVRHGVVEKTPKPCRISSGNSWVYTTFAIELETVR